MLGPVSGYFVNTTKSWLVTKACFYSKAEAGSKANLICEGCSYLGAAHAIYIGIDSFVQHFVEELVF